MADVDVEALEVLEVLLGVVADEDDVAFWVETGIVSIEGDYMDDWGLTRDYCKEHQASRMEA